MALKAAVRQGLKLNTWSIREACYYAQNLPVGPKPPSNGSSIEGEIYYWLINKQKKMVLQPDAFADGEARFNKGSIIRLLIKAPHIGLSDEVFKASKLPKALAGPSAANHQTVKAYRAGAKEIWRQYPKLPIITVAEMLDGNSEISELLPGEPFVVRAIENRIRSLAPGDRKPGRPKGGKTVVPKINWELVLQKIASANTIGI